MANESKIISIVETVLKRKGIDDATVEIESQLYEEGLGIDSLAAAELSAMLEKEFGSDPYTSGQLPQTVAHLVEFYADGA